MSTIVVVDGRVVNRQFPGTLFAYAGYRVVEAAHGAEALAAARREPVDLVFSDVLMPVMDGVELARQMRADATLAHIPVIFYTATYRQSDARKLAPGCGVQEVLGKPSEPAAILDAVARYVGPGTRPAPRPAQAPPAPPGPYLAQHLTGFVGDLVKLQEQLARTIESGQALVGRGGELRELSYGLSDAFTRLQTISLRLSAVVELGLQLSCERDAAHLVQTFCRGAQDILSARRAAAGTLASDGRTLEHLLAGGLDRAALEARGILAEVLAAGVAHRTPDRLIVPLKSPRRAHGWAWFEAKLGADAFSEEDEHFALTLAAQFSLAYENLQFCARTPHA